jgi:predicted negative regulator of RcsB-dependent stress response
VNDLSEKEQLDALRAWWAENGSYVMGGIAVGIVVIFGWNSWQQGIAEEEVAASTLFEDVMEASARGFIDSAIPPAESLFAEYPDSPYAAQARLALARLYMDRGRDQDAADVLRPLAESAADDELTLVARLRLARILLYQERPEEVIALASGQPETAFAARFNEILGDAHAALGQYSEAEAAYIAALNDNPLAPTVDATLIQLKINDLPAPDQAAAPVDAEVQVEEPMPADDADDETVNEEPAATEPAPETGEAGEPEAE